MTSVEDADFALALRLQEEEHRLAGTASVPSGPPSVGGKPSQSQWSSRRDCSPLRPPPSASLVDEAYELIDPTPDIYQLFRDFDKHFFWGKLGSVELKWSPRMTRCAGVCSYQPASGLCSVRLSKPLLTLRPRSDLVETLLHEMIHALLFVTHNSDNREEHGPEFHRHMHRINKIAGTKISVYHTFHEEVRHMLTHWWRCTGPCRRRPPHFGFVKRSMNRAPGKNDFWWRDHQASCGGVFEKIKEPEGYGKKKTKKEIVSGGSNKLQDIRNFVLSGKAAAPIKRPPARPKGASKPPGPPAGGSTRPRNSSAGAGGARPDRKPPTKRPPTGVAGKRSTSDAGGGDDGGAGAPKRPTGNPAGVRAGIGTVNNAGSQRVNNLANNVHGFQKTGRPRGGTALRGGAGSRTVTVPPRRGGASEERPPASSSGAAGTGGAPFGGVGHTLGGTRGVPWYKRDPPPAPPRSAPPAARQPTGIFSSPESDARPSSSVGGVTRENTACGDECSDIVACPVCGEQVSLREINDHVDRCLVTESSRPEGGESCAPIDVAGSVWDEEDADDQMLAEAADELETSLEASVWEEDDADERLLADTADELEMSQGLGSTNEACDSGDTYDSESGAVYNDDAALRSPASDASTVYDDILDGEAAMAAAGSAGPRSLASEASTVYNDILDGPIVIDSSSDEEDYSTQRANLSDTIKQFIRVDDSDDELFGD